MHSFCPATEAVLDAAFLHTVGRRFSDPGIQEALRSQSEKVYKPFRTPEFEQSPQGLLRRIGVHRAQELFYRHRSDVHALLDDAASQPVITPPSWDVVSTIESLAMFNLAIADQLLPAELCEAAEQWAGADASRQIELCRKVFAALRSKSGRSIMGEDFDAMDVNETWLKDYTDQPVERIFPRLFLGEAAATPNCLGKAQLLLAFCRRTKVRHFGFTPIQIAQDMTNHVLIQLSEVIEGIATKLEIELPEKLKRALARRSKLLQSMEASPSRFHMGVVLQLADGSWYMIDPHMQVHGLLSNPLELSYYSERFDLYSTALPGFCCLHAEGLGLKAQFDEAMLTASEVIDAAANMASSWKAHGYDPKLVIPLLCRSPALEILVREGIRAPKQLEEQLLEALTCDHYAVLTFGETEEARRVAIQIRTHGDRQPTPREYNSAQVAAIVLDFCCKGELIKGGGVASAETLSRAFKRCLGILIAIGYSRAAMAMQSDDESSGIIHSLIEVYEPQFRVGIELLAHINAIGSQSNEVVTDLARLCGGQHHLMLAATEHLRTGTSSRSELATGAARALQHSLLLLPDAREALSSFDSSGSLQPTGA